MDYFHFLSIAIAVPVGNLIYDNWGIRTFIYMGIYLQIFSIIESLLLINLIFSLNDVIYACEDICCEHKNDLFIIIYISIHLFHSGYNYLPLITIDILCILQYLWGFPGDTSVKEPAGQCRRHKRLGLNSWVWKIPWRRAGQPTPVFLPGESYGQRSLVGYKSIGSQRIRYN